jgi:6-phosphogluconolactonase (cycloisomerase 2 family)
LASPLDVGRILFVPENKRDEAGKRMKALMRTIPLLLAIALAGCGSSSTTPLQGPTVAYLFTAGQGTNTIFPFRAVADGELQSLSIAFPTNAIPVSMVLHPNKGLVYVANSTSNTVTGFTLNHQTGVLTPVGTAISPSSICPAPPCSTATPATSNPISVGIDSAGHFLFVLNQGVAGAIPAVNASISVFSIDTTRGLLTLVSGSPFALPSLSAGKVQSMVVSPTANVLYVSNGTDATIAQFTFDSNGQVTANGTIAASGGINPANLAGMVIDSKGQFLFSTDSANNAILSFSIPSSGALAPVATFALVQTKAETTPVALAIDSTGSFLYSANQGSDNATAMKVSSGTLSEISGSPYSTRGTVVSTAAQPSVIIVDATNAVVYVGNQGSRDIMAFTINSSNGALTTVANAPFSVSIAPAALLSTR